MKFDICLILEQIERLFAGDCSGHDYWHTVRVYNNALKIAREMECDLDVVALGALLHDVDDPKLFDTMNYENAKSIMEQAGVAGETINKVVEIISEVSYKGKDSVVPKSMEGKIVQDADRLDALGAIGIARTFAYGGSREIELYNPGIEPKTTLDENSYFTVKSSSVNHFYEKLFRLKDMMNTEIARRIAEERDEYMHQFIEKFMDEWKGIKI